MKPALRFNNDFLAGLLFLAFLLARGDPSPFFTRPISLAFMLGTALILAVMLAPALRRKKAA